MTQNTYEELSKFVVTPRGKRLAGCASKLAAAYKKADSDVVMAAAMLCGNFGSSTRTAESAVSEDCAAEILTRREWSVEKISAVTGILHNLREFSTISVQNPVKSASVGLIFEDAEPEQADSTDEPASKTFSSQAKNFTTAEISHKIPRERVEKPELSTLSTNFSTTKVKNDSLTVNSDCAEAENPPAALTLECKIVFDAVILSALGAVGLLERKNDEGPELFYKASDFYTKQGAFLFETLCNNENLLLSTLESEAREFDSSLENFAKNGVVEEPICHRLRLIRKSSGFRMEGYFVWCGSVVKFKDKYHMFASRWRESLTFPAGYMVGSEIVHATSDTPDGPFVYRDTVISQRPRGFWDSQFAHNPQIVKAGNGFVLFYLGAAVSKSEYRRIGYATAKSPDGPWTRSPHPIDLGIPDCNNPAAWISPDGSVLLAFRHSNQRIGIARAARFDAAYSVLSYDILPGISAEDPFLYHDGKRYVMLVEDGEGKLTGSVRHGATLWSDDGISWKTAPYVRAYGHTLMYDDLSMLEAERRERPQLLLDDGGRPTHLYTAVLYDGKTWNCCQEIAPR